MYQVKVLKNKSNLIERDINSYLANIGSVEGTKTELKDIKFNHDFANDMSVAMVIYNQYSVAVPSKPPTTPEPTTDS